MGRLIFFLLCFLYELLPFIVLIIILVAGVAICVLWDCFAILLVEKIDFAFTYSISYIRAIRDDPIVQKNYIAKLDKELELYNFEEKNSEDNYGTISCIIERNERRISE